MKKRILIISNSDLFFLSHRLDIGLEAISRGYEVHIATKFTDKKEILSKEKHYSKQRGKWIIPVPKVNIIR